MTTGSFGIRKLAASAALCVLALGFVSAPPSVAPAQAQAEQLPSVADLVDRLLPAVVEITIESKGPSAAPQLQLPGGDDNSPFKDFFDEFLKRQQDGGQPRTMTSMGSGFIVDASGYIVTNNHVVEGAETIEVHLQDDTLLKAELVGRDPKTDLAVLRVKAGAPLPTVSFGNSDLLRTGEWVIAIGNPLGVGASVSLGIVSARNRNIRSGPYDDYIQTDAAINRGNSGGPLFNLKGDVVGINTAIISPNGGSVGLGFSVPANTAKYVVDQLIKYGETRRGWLGVKIQQVTPDIAETMGLGRPRGALVADVTPTGPAEKAGIQAGDVIVEFNGRPVSQMRDLAKIVAETEIGKEVAVKVLRKGQEMTVTAQVGRLEDGEKLAAATPDAPATAPAVVSVLGMTVSSLSDDLRAKYSIDADLKGVVVTEVAADGPAAEKHLEAGDVITEAGEKEVQGAADIKTRADEAKAAGKTSLLLLVAKGGKQAEMRFIALKLAK